MSQSSSFWTGLFDDSDQDVQEIDEREFLGQEVDKPADKVTESDDDDEDATEIQELRTSSAKATRIVEELEGSTTEDELEVGRALVEEKSVPEANVDFLLELCRICHQGLRTDMMVSTLA